jgi:hypothetical protein
LPRIQSRLIIAAVALAVLAIIAIQPCMVTSQTLGPLEQRFGGTITALHQAETAGATPTEIESLVALLNKALELNNQAMNLNRANETQARTALVAQVNQILTTVEDQAAELTVVASQRTYMNKILTYAGGVVAAIVGTVGYAYVTSFYQKYRVKRTFQMRVTRK